MTAPLESTRSLRVEMLEATLGTHELIFRLAANAGVFHPISRARLIEIAEQYHDLRVALDSARKIGKEIDPSLFRIGSNGDLGLYRDVIRVAGGDTL